MIARKVAVLSWLDRWRNLRAWGRTLDNVEVRYRLAPESATHGRCWPAAQRIEISDVLAPMPTMLATVLHELAHAACRCGDDHGETWQATLAAAVEEVTGISVVTVASRHEDMHTAAEDAIRAWWRRSGQESIWKFIGEQARGNR